MELTAKMKAAAKAAQTPEYLQRQRWLCRKTEIIKNAGHYCQARLDGCGGWASFVWPKLPERPTAPQWTFHAVCPSCHAKLAASK